MRAAKPVRFVGMLLAITLMGMMYVVAGCSPVSSGQTESAGGETLVAIDLPPVATVAPVTGDATAETTSSTPQEKLTAGIAPPPIAPVLEPSTTVTEARPIAETVELPTTTPSPVAAENAETAAQTETEATDAEVTEADAPPAEAQASATGSEAFTPSPATQTSSATASQDAGSDRYYAVVVPFDTVRDDIALDEVRSLWQGAAPVYTTQDALDLLPPLLGDAAASTTVIGADALIGALEADRGAFGLIPFEQLDPRFKVLTVDGVNVLSNQLVRGSYPLIAANAGSNRDPGKLTTLVMTGVTAMARGTGAAIERAGRTTYPAEIIGPELAMADITHVSNEIPFLADCIVENYENNLVLCSHTSYWDALELMGTDIVGLSGNHVNDFGRDGARESLTWYQENNIPIYGSGFTVDEACAPLLWEDHGNTFAFIAALAYGPSTAWVTDEEPGACYYYDHKDRIINTVKLLSAAVDVVSVELQYEETYFAWPTETQVEEFRELRDAGATIVTGVQSHVPQAQEPYGAFDEGGAGMISYGLGNLFFDQMWSWETRTELYARHAIYDGRLISTEILTGVLEDYAQPRWTTPEERADLLQTIFDGAPERP